MVGILCGATTNTPALGAAQQTLKQMGLESSTPALGCAVAYPLGVVGVILAVLIIRKALARKEDLELKEKDDANKTYIAAFQVHNPAIFDKSIKEIGGLNYPKFVISRLWRDGNVSIPTSEKIIKEGDRLLVVTSEKYAPALTVLFGEQEHTDWNKEDIDWNLTAYRGDTSRAERKEAGFASPAQSLRHQHQPCVPQRRTVACHRGTDLAVG